jgi:hypothetical protein
MDTATTARASVAHESEPVRDWATKRGYYVTVRTTVGDYLTSLGLFDPASRRTNWDISVVHADFQRAVIGIKKNAVKTTMLRDVMRGGTIPPVCLAAVNGDLRPVIVDGLQRSHVELTGIKGLLQLETGEDVDPVVAQAIESIRQMDQRPLTVDEYLQQPFEYHRWHDLDQDELVRLFILLNAGQQKVSARHLLEVMGAQLRAMFQSWGLPLMTDRERREQIGKRSANRPVEGVNTFRYEYLINALIAYVDRNPHIKTTTLLQELSEGGSLDGRITDIDAECRADIVWLFHDLNRAMAAKYAGHPQWEHAVMSSDTFTYPLLAALGAARDFTVGRPAIEDRKAKLLQLLKGPSDDPLALLGDSPDRLGTILEGIKSNIGRRRRVITFGAFRRYFRHGPERQDYPLDWDLAQHD